MMSALRLLVSVVAATGYMQEVAVDPPPPVIPVTAQQLPNGVTNQPVDNANHGLVADTAEPSRRALLDWAAVATLAVGLMSSVVGLVSLRMARKAHEQTLAITREQIAASTKIAENQIRATVLAANRQAWINKLRSLLSQAIAQYHRVGMENLNALAHQREKGFTEEERARVRREMRGVLTRAQHLRSHVALMLNMAEQDHCEIMSRLEELLELVRLGNVETSSADIEAARESLIALCQQVLKREWEVTKALK